MKSKETSLLEYLLRWAKKIKAISYLGGKCKKCGDNNIFHLSFHHTGNKDKAIAEGKKAVTLAVLHKDIMVESDMIVNLAKIYTMLGLYKDALFNIEYSLKNPSLFSTKLLQIDPVWRPLLNRPEYKKMLEKYSNN